VTTTVGVINILLVWLRQHRSTQLAEKMRYYETLCCAISCHK